MKHERLKHVSPLPTNFSPKTGAIVERAQTPSVGECIVFVQQGKFIGTFMQNHAGTAHHQPAKTTHVCAPTEAYSISNHTGNRFALLLRKPRLGWAGVGLNLTSGARVAVGRLNWIF